MVILIIPSLLLVFLCPHSLIRAHTPLLYHFSDQITCTLLFHCLLLLDFHTLALTFLMLLVSAVTVGCVSTFEDLVLEASGGREQARYVFLGLGYLINMIFSSSSIYLKSLWFHFFPLEIDNILSFSIFWFKDFEWGWNLLKEESSYKHKRKEKGCERIEKKSRSL